ncbi:hypothetical protein NPIL_232571 [Nephila pilipes]|uniref:Uncharacterized protein n=1 Tax=Nephila pilipes TaxID=299642 RepID=A0A8X6NSC6_NEPPI|nr:hypothetical protein NPIL_232571 [Nephila pilipes]
MTKNLLSNSTDELQLQLDQTASLLGQITLMFGKRASLCLAGTTATGARNTTFFLNGLLVRALNDKELTCGLFHCPRYF